MDHVPHMIDGRDLVSDEFNKIERANDDEHRSRREKACELVVEPHWLPSRQKSEDQKRCVCVDAGTHTQTDRRQQSTDHGFGIGTTTGFAPRNPAGICTQALIAASRVPYLPQKTR